MHPPLPREIVAELQTALAGQPLYTDPGDCLPYGYDNSRLSACPQAVAFATTHAQVVALVQTCQRHRLPLTVRGRGTNTTGASVPTHGGVVLSLERMRQIIEINPADRLAVVEAGVTNGELQRALAPHGFFWAPDPTSADYASIGGNLACGAGGPRAVKYGTARENTLGLTAVTGSGATLHCGVRTTKGAVGYDLTRLLIGSEGTLAIITRATLKLTPRPAAEAVLLAQYRDAAAAAQAIAQLMAQPNGPATLEFMDAGALSLIREETGLPATVQALLLMSVQGQPEQLPAAIDTLARCAQVDGHLGVQTATDASAAQRLWQARKLLSPKLRQLAPNKINEDIVVPVSQIPALLEVLQQLSQRHRIRIVSFGHAGNGNLHVNLLGNAADADEAARMHSCLGEMFDAVLKLGGSLSGEHGVGIAKRDYIQRELGATHLALMHSIKQAFDPAGILNPGKLLPDPAP